MAKANYTGWRGAERKGRLEGWAWGGSLLRVLKGLLSFPGRVGRCLAPPLGWPQNQGNNPTRRPMMRDGCSQVLLSPHCETTPSLPPNVHKKLLEAIKHAA